MKILLLTLLFGLPAFGAVYYVSPTGNNAASGAIDAPWQTIYRGTRNYPWYINPGDTLYLRGGLYRGNTNAIDIGNTLGFSGTNGAPITIKAFPGEVPIVTDVTAAACITLQGKSGWVFDGIVYSNNYQSAYLNNCTNFWLTNCTFRTMRPDAGPNNYGYANVAFYNSSPSNRVVNCTFADWACIFTNIASANQYQIAGTHLSFGDETADAPAYWNLVRGNSFANGGHDCFQLNTAYTVVQSNIFHQEPFLATNSVRGWQFYNFGNGRVEPNLMGKWGARVTKPGDAGTTQVDMRNVFEWNQFYYASSPPDSAGAFGIELGTRQGIYRNNVIAFSHAAGIYFNTSGTTSQSTSNAVYNNVIYGNGLCYVFGNSNAYGFSYGMTMSTFEGRRTNNFVVNNIITRNRPMNVDPAILTYQRFRNNFTNDSVNPLFFSTNGFGITYSATNLPDFRLQGSSPCIDAGTWLAFAVGAGSGQLLTVDNSLYFSDGNRIVEGDLIQLQGQTTRVRVVANDWTNGILSLSAPLTWSAGQGVSLAYNGSAPDMGAFEAETQAIPGATNSARVVIAGGGVSSGKAAVN